MSLILKEMEAEQRWTVEEMTEKMNVIHHMDCLDFMKRVPDDYFDLCLTDPPYVISKQDCGNGIGSVDKFRSSKLKQISDGFDVNLFLNEFLRISKKCNMFIFCSNAQVSEIMKWGENKGFYTTCLVWHKPNTPPFCNGTWLSDIEFTIHIREKGAYFEGGMSLKNKVTKLPTNPSKFGHPTEKPLKIIEKYLQVGADKHHKVFDPFLGSGTTAIACKSLGLEWCGCELEEDYVGIANKRLEKVQGALF